MVLWMVVVTGLHDMDEFVQSQLILAVSSHLFLCLHPAHFFINKLQYSYDEYQIKVLTSGLLDSVACSAIEFLYSACGEDLSLYVAPR